MTQTQPESHTTSGRETWPTMPDVALRPPFTDARGGIQPLVDIPMQSAVLIETLKGAIRANHYHKTDWHFCYVVKGCIDYRHRPTGSTGHPEQLLVPAGSMVFTPPMVDHLMKFPEDTVFLCLSRNPRDQASYEADVVRIDLVQD